VPVPVLGQHEHGAPADSVARGAPAPVAGAAGVSLTRMSSGTAWLPDAARLHAYHATLGAWAVMLHGAVFLQYDRQSGTRAAEQLGSINWLMAVATRSAGRGAVRLRAMVSAEPWTVTGRGYPELLQVAEPYQGTTVTDRQHPHDVVSELAVLYERPVGAAGLSLYLAPVGEPALGPVAYMHRPSAAYDPVAPLGHHAQDFTHISDGVATLGVFTRRFKLEGSVFNGAHPDEVRTDLDPVRLDAYGGRLSFNPSAGSSLTAWFGHIPATGGAHAHDALDRFGASFLHTRPLAGSGEWSTALVYGADLPAGAGHPLNSLLVETSLELGRNAVFERAEYVRRTAADLALVGSVSRELNIGNVSAGYARELCGRGVSCALGVLGTLYLVPAELELFYGSRMPVGILAYLELRPAIAAHGHVMPR